MFLAGKMVRKNVMTPTCANKSGQVYTSSYDSWGNVTTRYISGTTASLSYDILDHFTE